MIGDFCFSGISIINCSVEPSINESSYPNDENWVVSL